MGKRFSKQRHKPRFTKVQIPWLIRGVIRSNNLESMQYLLSYPNDVNPCMVIDGVCPLNLAIELGHLQMVKLLIKAGADIHVSDCPRYPLHQAALFGRAAIAEQLINSGAKVTTLTERRQSCLHLLAGQSAERYVETAKVLLKHGCDPNNLDDDGMAPLHLASVEIGEVLASHEKTDLNILSQAGDTPLLVASKDRKEGLLLTLLRVEDEHKSKAAATIPSTPTDTSLNIITTTSLALASGSSASSPNRRFGWTSKVLRTASASAAASNTITVANTASTTDNTTSVQHCNRLLPSANFRNCLSATSVWNFNSLTGRNSSFRGLMTGGKRKNTTSLEVVADSSSAASNHPVIVKPPPSRLNLNQADNVGMTPLMLCAEAGQSGFRMVFALVSAGCDISAVDKIGMTALHYACYVGAVPTVRFLLEEALEFSDKKAYDILNLQDRFGRTPIYLATCRGHTPVVDYLLTCNADIHIPNKELKSPLYIAANFGHLNIVNALLRHGAQVNQADSHQKTPLYVATYHGRSDIVSLLLAAHADVNAAEMNGRTPLYAAVLHGHLDLAAKLLSHGAAVNRPDKDGLGPLHMAVKFPKLDLPMVRLLLRHGCDPVNLAAFTRWLMQHGVLSESSLVSSPGQSDAWLSAWLHKEESNVRSLKRLCRARIQAQLGGSGSSGTTARIRCLPLPPQLREFVSLKAL
ncbi:Tankyrase-1 [Echinococcus granulosus]|uniref:Ankyrin 23:unc44 n=1 Tax=Echinococcus granulosus TaxID=6210 RepID=U6JE90_ECHGR|nr:Tankyrase-1 [Echinococcus granulosus]EUB56959.1 Tankyrase-1 [Echinococcus granulosus]KAH9279558.1 Tankyrase-1 [Echinococcus granulosus]CDS22398.1 ankyrin 23:unc44 [Echinococcus granulosus]